MKIKICGITNLEDALAAIDAGADILGFNFYPESTRYITPEKCAEITNHVICNAKPVTTVGVFVNMPCKQVAAILDQCGLNFAQLSGDEPKTDLEYLGQGAFKALRIQDPQAAPAILAALPSRVNPPSCLLDAYIPGKYGGTGQITNWELARSLARQASILLAGGLTPDNVTEAVQQVHPWGVDVASGVESSPGHKDSGKMAAFIQAARQAIQEIPLTIEPACPAEAAKILALQKLAYQSEAAIYDDYSIPPLTQALPEIEAEFAHQSFYKAATDGHIVGSVRAYMQGNTCHIGRLIVHPDWQNQGIGSRLMQAIEQRFNDALRYELFTGAQSTRNIYLYQKLGYRIFRWECINEKMDLVYLEKRKAS